MLAVPLIGDRSLMLTARATSPVFTRRCHVTPTRRRNYDASTRRRPCTHRVARRLSLTAAARQDSNKILAVLAAAVFAKQIDTKITLSESKNRR